MTAPEWSRRERTDQIGVDERAVSIEADEGERAAIARRFDLVSIERLAADFAIRRDAAGVLATGRVRARVVQACSITGDPLPQDIDETVTLRFVEPVVGEEEVELGHDALDTIEVEDGAIDLGEAAAETVALALDPFPRSPRAAEVLRTAGVISEEEAKPKGALAGLGALLARNDP